MNLTRPPRRNFRKRFASSALSALQPQPRPIHFVLSRIDNRPIQYVCSGQKRGTPCYTPSERQIVCLIFIVCTTNRCLLKKNMIICDIWLQTWKPRQSLYLQCWDRVLQTSQIRLFATVLQYYMYTLPNFPTIKFHGSHDHDAQTCRVWLINVQGHFSYYHQSFTFHDKTRHQAVIDHVLCR
jgi:hypothetical protein